VGLSRATERACVRPGRGVQTESRAPDPLVECRVTVDQGVSHEATALGGTQRQPSEAEDGGGCRPAGRGEAGWSGPSEA
jgi:hypothetical protein